MNRSKIITDLFNNTVEGTFKDLSMGAQVALVSRCLRATLRNITYWEGRDDERAQIMVSQLERALPGMFKFLNSAANYSEGVSRYVEFDTTGHDDNGDITGGSEWDDVVVNGNPHAWAKRLLIEESLWDDNVDFSIDHPLMLPALSEAADRIAGQLVSKIMTVLGSGEFYVAKNTDARDIEIMSLSPTALSIARMDERSRLRAAYQHALRNTHFGVSKKQLMDSFDEMVQLDEDDEVEAEIKRDKRQARGAVNEIIKTSAKAALIEGVAARLKAAGLSEDLIAATVAGMLK